MKSRLFAMGLAVLSAGLVACGGGGGGGGGITPSGPTPTPQPTSTPTPAATNNPYGCVGQPPFTTTAAARRSSIAHPIAAGDAFTYSGTLTKTYTQSSPCPQPTATAVASVIVNVTDSATTAPGGNGSATDSKSAETDTYATQTTATTTDQVVQNAAAGFVLYSTVSSDGAGNSISTNYNVAQLLDKGPGTAGTWQNDPSGAITETLADGTRISRTVAADGSYTDTETFADGSTSTIVVNGAVNGKTADGSGTYDIAGTTLTYAAPSGGNITETSSSGKTSTYPAWFASANPLVTDTFTDNGTVAIDANCGLSSAIATQGTQIQETLTTLDPVLGYTDTRVTTSYVVNGFGTVCVAITDTLKSYYDYQLDTTKIYRSQNGQPNSVNAITEYLYMTAPTSALPASRTAQSTGVSPALVSARIAAISHQRSIEIAKRSAELHTLLLHLRAKGAVQ